MSEERGADWHPPKIGTMETRGERLSFLIGKVFLVMPEREAAPRFLNALRDDNEPESIVARAAHAAISASGTSLAIALNSFTETMNAAANFLQARGKGSVALMHDVDIETMHRHVLNVNAARRNIDLSAGATEAVVLAALNILAPLEALITDQLLKKNLGPLQDELGRHGKEGTEIRTSLRRAVQLHDFMGTGVGIDRLVNGWRHGTAHVDNLFLHHAEASRPIDVRTLLCYAEYAIAMWEAGQIYYVTLLSIGPQPARTGALV